MCTILEIEYLYAYLANCIFYTRVVFLGFVVLAERMELNEEKIKVIRGLFHPQFW
jgi:hypothetical protein